MAFRLHELAVASEQDIVTVRQRCRRTAGLLGFGSQEQTRIATAVSEATRAVFRTVTDMRLSFDIRQENDVPVLDITLSPAAGAAPFRIQDDPLLSAACRLMDACRLDSSAGEAWAIVLSRRLPMAAGWDAGRLQSVAGQLGTRETPSSLEELAQQNRELLHALAELKVKQEELSALTRELEDTNRGVVALYAEIEEKAERLRRADEMKSRFLSNTSHELRTPLSSIRALSQLLLDRLDGELTPEQETQVGLIKNAAIDLSQLVNDLLDLAKIEAGKVAVIRSMFPVQDLFAALRGMMKPLVSSDAVSLVFVDPQPGLAMDSDEGKVSQILRNLIFNALKFTEQGEVRVSGTPEPDGGIRFDVVDTGIGIEEKDLSLIFEEFGQVGNRLQKQGKGTGLGLPLCQKLAELLGGRIEVRSVPGRGSTFSLILPAAPPEPAGDADDE